MIQNAPEKCAIVDRRPVENVVYDESAGKASYNSKTFEVPKIIVVDTLLSAGQFDTALDDGVCIGYQGNCSLGAALQQAAVLAQTTEVTVKVGPGLYQIAGLPAIELKPGSFDMTVDGGSLATTYIDGGGLSSIFNISAKGSKVNILNFTLQNGDASRGGAIDSYEADLLVENCLIQNNRAYSGGGISASKGKLKIKNTRFYRNSVRYNVGRPGDAIYSESNSVFEIFNAEVFNHLENGSNGVIFSWNDGSVIMNGLSAYENTSAAPALMVRDPITSFNVMNSTFAYNTGYGVRVQCMLGCLSQGVSIQNSTFYENKLGTTIPARNLSMAGNGAPIPLQFNNNILGIIGGGGNCSPFMDSSWGYPDSFLITSRNNLMTENSCAFGGIGNIETTNLAFATLDYTGGFGKTLTPTPGSGAIDAGDNLTCLTVDQRNLPRPVDKLGGGAICDIGAVEVQ